MRGKMMRYDDDDGDDDDDDDDENASRLTQNARLHGKINLAHQALCLFPIGKRVV